MTKPKRVDKIEEYWTDPAPELSARCLWWIDCIQHGWKPNRRIRSFGYYESAEFYGVYIYEYINVLAPLMQQSDDSMTLSPT